MSNQTLKKNTTGISGFIVGIIALCLCFVPLVGFILAVIGMVNSIIGTAKRKKYKRTVLPVIGIVLSSLALVGGLFFLITFWNYINRPRLRTDFSTSGELKNTYTYTETKEEITESCLHVEYSDVARNPNNYDGNRICFEGKVIQVQESEKTDDVVYRVAEDSDYNKIWLVTYVVSGGYDRILENDYVIVYGDCTGVTQYTTVMGNLMTIPSIDAKIIDLYENATDTPALETQKYEVGETYTTGGMSYTLVSSGIYESESKYNQPKDGNMFVFVEFELENNSSKDSIGGTFKCFADGYECDKAYISDDSLSSDVSAGRKARGKVYYEVPKSCGIVEIEVSEYLSSEKGIFVIRDL